MNRRSPALAFALTALAATLLPATPLAAQTLDDAVFMSKREVCASLFLKRDSWSQYWEGSLKRSNGNIGTLTTTEVSYMGAYGITDRFTVMASLPYVRTNASAGVLQGQRGVQDLTVSAKYKLLTTPLTTAGTLKVLAVAGVGTPVSDYTPDFLPMSIGASSKRVIGRGTLQFMSHKGWYVNGSAGYTWRSNVTLSRPAYYTNGQLTLSDQVRMPDVTDYVVALGYDRRGLNITIPFTSQRTLGGGDIRRQDMPFVSNRMNLSKVEARVQFQIPKVNIASLRVEASHVLDGRNVGQSTGFSLGLILAGRP